MFIPTFQYVVRLTIQLMIDGATTMRVILEEEDRVKLKYLTFSLIAARTSSMSNNLAPVL